MSNQELFLIGLGVTLLMIVAIGPLIWAAVLDGRYNDEMQTQYRDDRVKS